MKLAKDLRQRILGGESFSKLAETYSNDPGSAKKGGYLGTVSKGELADTMEKYVWSAPVGQLSDVIQTQYGFHIAIVDFRKVSETDQAIEADKKRLAEELERRRQERKKQE